MSKLLCLEGVQMINYIDNNFEYPLLVQNYIFFRICYLFFLRSVIPLCMFVASKGLCKSVLGVQRIELYPI